MIEQELASGQRFRFGENWSRFLEVLDDERIKVAEDSLKEMLQTGNLAGQKFLDIGCGSGLFSLAARRLGADVLSFDYDPHSVACAQELKSRFFENDGNWQIFQGSVLDEDFMDNLGEFDIVYSWGVLHHTGSMWEAISNAVARVKLGGKFFIAIYNDQGWQSIVWSLIKRMYCSGSFGRWLAMMTFIPLFLLGGLVTDVLALRSPFKRYTNYKSRRGMSVYHDWLDWLGGYPFEVASRQAIIDFFNQNGFSLANIISAGRRLGCNEFVFSRIR
jgi:2-polyprenyl-6-hydroxyphenyl methylase/3-demethylubiquinone-9 3-methyltransferase